MRLGVRRPGVEGIVAGPLPRWERFGALFGRDGDTPLTALPMTAPGIGIGIGTGTGDSLSLSE
jgi:hypothetical protein